MRQNISLVTLTVRDIAEARRFFEDGMGWTPAGAPMEHTVFYQTGGSGLALYQRAMLEKDIGRPVPDETYGAITIAFNAASETEVDEAYAQALAAGAKEIQKPEKVFWGGYSSYVRIPGGHALEIAYNPFWPLGEDGSIQIT